MNNEVTTNKATTSRRWLDMRASFRRKIDYFLVLAVRRRWPATWPFDPLRATSCGFLFFFLPLFFFARGAARVSSRAFSCANGGRRGTGMGAGVEQRLDRVDRVRREEVGIGVEIDH